MKHYSYVLGLSLLCLTFGLNAQQLNLSQGQEYKITTALSTSSAMQRGDKSMMLSSISYVTNTYTVSEANAQGYKIKITTTHIADTINAFNQKLAYNTNAPADPKSEIETALKKLIGNSYTIGINKAGKITSVEDLQNIQAYALVAAAAGLYYKEIKVGNTLNFGAFFKLPEQAKVGYSWPEERNTDQAKAKITYTIEKVTAKQTQISYKTEESQQGVNTNVNGALLLDNETGVVMVRVVKANALSNEAIEGKIFMANRKRDIVESCVKIK